MATQQLLLICVVIVLSLTGHEDTSSSPSLTPSVYSQEASLLLRRPPAPTPNKTVGKETVENPAHNPAEAQTGERNSSSTKVVQVEVEPSAARTAQSNGEDAELETPMMTPAASFSDGWPLHQPHKSQDTSTAAQLPLFPGSRCWSYLPLQLELPTLVWVQTLPFC